MRFLRAHPCFGFLIWTVPVAACGVTDPADAVDVELIVSDSVVSSSAPVTVRIDATNRGLRPVSISTTGCPQLFRVADEAGREVGPEAALCLLAIFPPKRLAPGETHSFAYEWRGGSKSGEGELVPAGRYELRGWVLTASGRRVLSNTVDVRMISETGH